jgi:hypothetical protein
MARCSNHPNVIKFIGILVRCSEHDENAASTGACIENSLVCIVTELQRCSVFHAIVEYKESFTMQQMRKIVYQV